MTELSTRYEPAAIEEAWYSHWEKSGHFRSEPDGEKTPFTIMIPPPNVTGALHMGHALNNTLQDILIRFNRMRGREALWLPGTDHAGIATQNVVTRKLHEEGTSREEVGREKFLERVWQWKEQYGGRIIDQLKRLGCSCDWERTRFTMDEGLSRAVREVFVHLYDEGLVYRGKYLVNWCPSCRTALSDDEVEHAEESGSLWYIKYPVKTGSKDYIEVATTRPETMLGDTAVAVHPDDERYVNLVEKSVTLPILERELRVIADAFVDPRFGTGAVKVTPAHDPNDFEMGRRHGLEEISVMDEVGRMNEKAGPYAGMDRFECREKLIEDLDKAGLISKTEEHTPSVGHCYRCNAVVEPFLSEQWFVKMEPLAKAAIEATNRDKVVFHPQRWTKVYLQWLENVRDWCISRQLWWGHRIPIWYCDDCEKVIAAVEAPKVCPQCRSEHLRQDEDVLDTWFSSALWPFSTLGWPEETDDLDYYYPTDVLVTDRGIIYFWVARMVMMGLKVMRNVPFTDVYIHGTILDEFGRKMSKSAGNGIDPIEMIGRFGADAVRFSLIMLTAEGQDVRLAPTKFSMGRDFANKLWNASRFCLMKLSEGEPAGGEIPKKPSDLDFYDRWILSRMNRTVEAVTRVLEDFKFSEAARLVYDFVWHDFCDWYLELVKGRLSGRTSATSTLRARRTLVSVLDAILRLLHTIMPFITEEVWKHLGEAGPERGLLGDDSPEVPANVITAAWPEARAEFIDDAVEAEMAALQDVIRGVRNIRAKRRIAPGEKVKVTISCADDERKALLQVHIGTIAEIANTSPPELGIALPKPEGAAVEVLGGMQVFVPATGNIEAERERAGRELARQEKYFAAVDARLRNTQFLKKAPPEVVEKNERQRAEIVDKIEKLRKHIGSLDGE